MEKAMKHQLLALLLALLVLLSGCAAPKETHSSGPAFTFTDDLQRQITVSSPQRVAALLGSFAHIWQLAGGQVVASPDDAWKDLHLTLPDDAVSLGGLKNLSLELLLSSAPDLVLASTNTRQHMEWRATLEAAGIPVAYFDVTDVEDYLRMLRICTGITGRSDLYQLNGANVQAQIDRALAHSRERLATSPVPTVLSLTASASFVKAKGSEGNVLGAMLKALGCQNIADSDSALLEDVSIEHILLCDPDYIMIVQRGDDTEGMRAYVEDYLTEHPAWQQLTAVRNGRVFFMEKDLYSLKPNNRWGEAYEKLENLLSLP